MSVSAEYTLAMASLHASLQSIRMIANAGLASPEDIDGSLDGVTQTLEHLPEEMFAKLQPILDRQFAAIKQAAAINWIED